MAGPVIRFRIDFTADLHVGPGKIELLEAIRESGSVSQAARELGMSYRRAWLLVESFKGAFGEAVTVASTGGRGGGGVELTAFGAKLIAEYRALEHEINALAARRLRGISAAIKGSVPGPKVGPRSLARAKHG